MKKPKIERSTGIVVPGWFGPRPGGGYSGANEELDALVVRASEAVAELTGRDVEIRFNSDRQSGGAFVRGEEGPRIFGIGARYGPLKLPDDFWDLPSRKERDAVWEAAPKGIWLDVLAGRDLLRDPAESYDRREPERKLDDRAYVEFDDLEAAVAWVREHCDLSRLTSKKRRKKA